MDFTGKTAISTGAASGMGLLFAQNWADLGGNVLMCDVNEEVLNEKVAEINANNKGKATGVVCDVRDYAQICSARDKAVETFGSIDVMANFAGGTAVRMRNVDREVYPEFPDVPIDVYDWGIDVNLKGPFYFAHAVLKQMREQKSGLIINIGSIVGLTPLRIQCAFTAAKAGVFNLSKAMALELAPLNIRVNAIAPGSIMFEGTRKLFYADAQKAEAILSHIPMHRAGDPGEIAAMTCFLASEEASYMTGSVVTIDGGWICGYTRDF